MEMCLFETVLSSSLRFVSDFYLLRNVVLYTDDLDIAPDFFEYFLGTYPLLIKDSSLWCISAWNDNGKSELVDEKGHHLLYRTDFFPGLGWMLTKDTWKELGPKWPKSYVQFS